MRTESYENIENKECELCGKPAKILYVSINSRWGIKIRLEWYCKECARKHKIVRSNK